MATITPTSMSTSRPTASASSALRHNLRRTATTAEPAAAHGHHFGGRRRSPCRKWKRSTWLPAPPPPAREEDTEADRAAARPHNSGKPFAPNDTGGVHRCRSTARNSVGRKSRAAVCRANGDPREIQPQALTPPSGRVRRLQPGRGPPLWTTNKIGHNDHRIHAAAPPNPEPLPASSAKLTTRGPHAAAERRALEREGLVAERERGGSRQLRVLNGPHALPRRRDTGQSLRSSTTFAFARQAGRS